MAWILAKKKIFFNTFSTFNWSTPMWSLETLKDTFYNLGEILEEKQIFDSHLLWWDVGYKSLHIHCMGRGSFDVASLRDKLSRIWQGLFYRRGHVYSRVYRTPNPYIQASYFRKHLAQAYVKKGWQRDRALLRGWKKIGYGINFPRFILTRGYDNGPIRGHVFSPYSHLSDAVIKAVTQHRHHIKSMISLTTSRKPSKWLQDVESFGWSSRPTFKILTRTFDDFRAEIYLPQELNPRIIEYARARWQSNRNDTMTAYGVRTEHPRLFLLGRLHGQVIKARGDCVITATAGSRKLRSRSKSWQQTRLRKVYEYPRAWGEKKWGQKIQALNIKVASAFNITMPNVLWTEAKAWGKTLKELFEEEGTWATFTAKQMTLKDWSLSGLCNNGPILKQCIFPFLQAQTNFSLFTRSMKGEDLTSQAFVTSLPSHPSFGARSIRYTTKLGL